MKKILSIIFLIFVLALPIAAQQNAKADVARPDSLKLPAERGAQLKQIQERQDALAKEFQALETQKIIIAQRAALEMHLTAEQVDQMELATDGEGYVFKPKEQPLNKQSPTDPKSQKKAQ